MAENHQTAPFDPPVRYIVRFDDASNHYLSVEAVLPAGGPSEIDVFLPVWTPGSYLIREYSRHIEAMAASRTDGSPLRIWKTRKNRWRIESAGAPEIRLIYRVYCREMSVRTNWVEDSFAFVNGASTFVTLVESPGRAHEVQLELPPHWPRSITGLQACGGAHRYRAQNYDILVDSPILCGDPATWSFEVNGIPHVLADEGEHGVWDGPRSAADAERIVRQHMALFGALPYERYVFLNLLVEARGGLEHRNSMCLMASRWSTRTRHAYLGWLHLVSHEFFHVWNVKRLHPVELGPFDYENENYTRSLWVAEGITDYYGPLAVRRAGLSTVDEYLDALSDTIRALDATPGRLEQSLEQSSWDAWIKLYRPDENSVNTTISYYTKGAVVAWLLDVRIRSATGGAKSLDDLMRAALARFCGGSGFTAEEFKSLAASIAGTPLDDFFRHTVESTEDLDYSVALDCFGLRFEHECKTAATLDCETRVDHGRVIVSKVRRGTPAFRAGLNVDDEIVAIQGFRVRADQLGQRLENYQPGDTIPILIARRERLRTIDLTLGIEPVRRRLAIRPDATEAQKRNLAGWLCLQPER
ncbi:MAG TPA: PDZ domain-containing protein [Bryobacteraceae bacterium]|nr:PDZ domain-containing protein [Bryobacteraceae bacterium]